MNEFWKGFFVGWFLFAVIAMSFLLLTGCATAGLQGKDAELVQRNSYNVGRIEGTVGSLEDTISDSRERLEIIARAGQRIADGVDRLEYLFEEYESEVERILGELDRLKAQLEEVEDGGHKRMGNPALPYSGVRGEEAGLPSEVLIDGTAGGVTPGAAHTVPRGGEAYGYTSGYV